MSKEDAFKYAGALQTTHEKDLARIENMKQWQKWKAAKYPKEN